MIRFLYFTHRWVGVALALFMLLWFSSGLIIAYSGSIVTTPEQRLSHAEALRPEAGWLSLGEAISASAEARRIFGAALRSGGEHAQGGMGGAAQDQTEGQSDIILGRLVRLNDAPVWRLENSLGERFAVSARDGGLNSFTPDEAKQLAEWWLAQDARNGAAPARPPLTYVDTFNYATSLRNYAKYAPFHRFAVEDGEGSELIVSARTGEVLQKATRFERGLYYAGNFTHLFRPLDLLGAGELRRNALLWAGSFAFVAALTGLIIGWLRWKPGFFGRPTYSSGRVQPYREFWLKYHFWAGLIGGTFAILWAFSGSLSTNPFQIFSEAAPDREALALYRGDAGEAAAAAEIPQIPAAVGDAVVELGWTHLGDRAQLPAFTRDGERIAQKGGEENKGLDETVLLAAAQRFAGKDVIAGHAVLGDYDSYYYANRRQGRLDRPLPILRVDLADASHTSLYIDPLDGQLLTRIDSSRRAYRWLYGALHHWDFGWLQTRPIGLAWITIWAGFGLVLATSAVVLGWRRLRRTIKAKLPVPQPDAAPAGLTRATADS